MYGSFLRHKLVWAVHAWLISTEIVSHSISWKSLVFDQLDEAKQYSITDFADCKEPIGLILITGPYCIDIGHAYFHGAQLRDMAL
jgi:hypothetical protein